MADTSNKASTVSAETISLQRDHLSKFVADTERSKLGLAKQELELQKLDLENRNTLTQFQIEQQAATAERGQDAQLQQYREYQDHQTGGQQEAQRHDMEKIATAFDNAKKMTDLDWKKRLALAKDENDLERFRIDRETDLFLKNLEVSRVIDDSARAKGQSGRAVGALMKDLGTKIEDAEKIRGAVDLASIDFQNELTNHPKDTLELLVSAGHDWRGLGFLLTRATSLAGRDTDIGDRMSEMEHDEEEASFAAMDEAILRVGAEGTKQGGWFKGIFKSLFSKDPGLFAYTDLDEKTGRAVVANVFSWMGTQMQSNGQAELLYESDTALNVIMDYADGKISKEDADDEFKALRFEGREMVVSSMIDALNDVLRESLKTMKGSKGGKDKNVLASISNGRQYVNKIIDSARELGRFEDMKTLESQMEAAANAVEDMDDSELAEILEDPVVAKVLGGLDSPAVKRALRLTSKRSRLEAESREMTRGLAESSGQMHKDLLDRRGSHLEDLGGLYE